MNWKINIMTDRGIIKNSEYFSQPVLFHGLRFGRITPTDIDGVIDFGNKLFIFIETKHGINTELQTGQRLALERIASAIQSDTKDAIVFFTWHDFNGEIDLANTIISKYYYRNKWHYPKLSGIKLIDAVNGMLIKFNINI